MPPNKDIFYQYLVLHSLLIGIFPFYMPVYLWKQGFGLGDICYFIALAGIGFSVALWVWDRLRHEVSLTTLIGLSLVLELVLLVSVYVLEVSYVYLLILGITYGIYNCFYWTTLRALFFDLIDTESSGRKYGNLQIFVGASLQVGIVIGGVLLEKASFIYLLVTSSIIALSGYVLITYSKTVYPKVLYQTDSLNLRDILSFSDQEHSRLIFVIDGLFLFAESFFWVITLYFIAHESFATLGIMTLSLAVIFGILFYLLKNTIDRLGKARIYFVAVILYAASWVLRAVTDDQLPLGLLYASLVIVVFCTTFFRLAMNKRFYDLAKITLSHDYLVLKSYYTQVAIVVLFGLLGLSSNQFKSDESLLVVIYWSSAALSLVYLLYGSRQQSFQQNVSSKIVD